MRFLTKFLVIFTRFGKKCKKWPFFGLDLSKSHFFEKTVLFIKKKMAKKMVKNWPLFEQTVQLDQKVAIFETIFSKKNELFRKKCLLTFLKAAQKKALFTQLRCFWGLKPIFGRKKCVPFSHFLTKSRKNDFLIKSRPYFAFFFWVFDKKWSKLTF